MASSARWSVPGTVTVRMDDAMLPRVRTWSMVVNAGCQLCDGNVGAKPAPVCSTESLYPLVSRSRNW